jgi:hypothetical protein
VVSPPLKAKTISSLSPKICQLLKTEKIGSYMSNPSRMTLPLIPYSLGKGRSKLPRSAIHLNICLPYLMRSISNEKRTGGNCTPSNACPPLLSQFDATICFVSSKTLQIIVASSASLLLLLLCSLMFSPPYSCHHLRHLTRFPSRQLPLTASSPIVCVSHQSAQQNGACTRCLVVPVRGPPWVCETRVLGRSRGGG